MDATLAQPPKVALGLQNKKTPLVSVLSPVICLKLARVFGDFINPAAFGTSASFSSPAGGGSRAHVILKVLWIYKIKSIDWLS